MATGATLIVGGTGGLAGTWPSIEPGGLARSAPVPVRPR